MRRETEQANQRPIEHDRRDNAAAQPLAGTDLLTWRVILGVAFGTRGLSSDEFRGKRFSRELTYLRQQCLSEPLGGSKVKRSAIRFDEVHIATIDTTQFERRLQNKTCPLGEIVTGIERLNQRLHDALRLFDTSAGCDVDQREVEQGLAANGNRHQTDLSVPILAVGPSMDPFEDRRTRLQRLLHELVQLLSRRHVAVLERGRNIEECPS